VTAFTAECDECIDIHCFTAECECQLHAKNVMNLLTFTAECECQPIRCESKKLDHFLFEHNFGKY